jgi:hypothetical protein
MGVILYSRTLCAMAVRAMVNDMIDAPRARGLVQILVHSVSPSLSSTPFVTARVEMLQRKQPSGCFLFPLVITPSQTARSHCSNGSSGATPLLPHLDETANKPSHRRTYPLHSVWQSVEVTDTCPSPNCRSLAAASNPGASAERD